MENHAINPDDDDSLGDHQKAVDGSNVNQRQMEYDEMKEKRGRERRCRSSASDVGRGGDSMIGVDRTF